MDTLNFATEVDDDKLSDCECVQNPMKMNNKQTSDRCVEWGSFAKEIHYDEHSNNGKEHDFPVDVERVHNHEDVKQHTMGSAHEITAKSNACLFGMEKSEARVSDRDVDTTRICASQTLLLFSSQVEVQFPGNAPGN